MKVALAGPLANLLIAVIFGLLIRFLPLPEIILVLFSIIVLLNILLAVFNLVPIPPLDGSHILFGLLPERFWKLKMLLYQYGMFLLILFIFFGLHYLSPLIRGIYFLIAGNSGQFF